MLTAKPYRTARSERAARVAAAGEALYGPRWQTSLARDLGVAARTVQRWHAGDRVVPSRVAGELRELLVERRVGIDALLVELSGRQL